MGSLRHSNTKLSYSDHFFCCFLVTKNLKDNVIKNGLRTITSWVKIYSIHNVLQKRALISLASIEAKYFVIFPKMHIFQIRDH